MTSPHRRRSHSTSSPQSSHQFAVEKLRPSSKRARPSTPRIPSYKDFALDQKLDVDRWRNGKRARRDRSVSTISFSGEHNILSLVSKISGSTPRGPCLFGASSVFREESALALPLSPCLPSTSDAFHLFSGRSRQTSSTCHLSRTPDNVSVIPVEETSTDAEDLNKLRSDAFCELQRSIVDSGEGLVSRMRDWEESRSRPSYRLPRPSRNHLEAERGRQQSSFVHQPTCSHPGLEQNDSDEDDIQIVSEGSPSVSSLPWGPPWPKKALSLGDMDIDEPESERGESERCTSPSDLNSGLSYYAYEDDAPSLSSTYTSSTNSSLTSLPLHSHSPSSPQAQSYLSFGVPSAPSPSEKAIAALTLVIANGAGGLNDYEAVRAVDSQSPSVSRDESLVGEMWN